MTFDGNYGFAAVVKSNMAALRHLVRVLAFLGTAVFALAQPPSAGRIVYVHAPDGGPPWPIEDIYLMNADGSGAKALTTDGHSHGPAWSPDGRRILFIHDSALRVKPAYREHGYETYHPVDLYVMDANGGSLHLLRRLEPVIEGAAWSPDGKTIAITYMPEPWANRPDPMDRVGLFLLPADSRSKSRLLFRNAYTPAWSPNSGKLAFSVEQPRGLWSVHVANVDGSGDVRLSDPQNIGGSPAWSPDGKRIAFDQMADERRRQQVFVMDADGSHVRQLTLDPNWSCAHASWSPDGNWIVFSCRSASRPCGGVSSVGTILPECDRRIFTLSAHDPNARPKQLGEHDGAAPAFAPVR